ncbi:unnamed protein product [marine sediment metagenome]|uniref:DUF559 domain-containing protein n=1 Tax=marine sediment metagenome TaxID=412755 RepID=X1N012_9ZZZZ
MKKYNFKNVSNTRYKTMKAIKGCHTSIEIKLRKTLFKLGYRYRINYKKLPGSPDIVFTKKKLAIFCDSGFWHGKTFEKKRKTIKNNRDYWIKKIQENIKRDKKNNKELKKLGWVVLRFWETDINKNLEKVITKIQKVLNQNYKQSIK